VLVYGGCWVSEQWVGGASSLSHKTVFSKKAAPRPRQQTTGGVWGVGGLRRESPPISRPPKYHLALKKNSEIKSGVGGEKIASGSSVVRTPAGGGGDTPSLLDPPLLARGYLLSPKKRTNKKVTAGIVGKARVLSGVTICPSLKTIR